MFFKCCLGVVAAASFIFNFLFCVPLLKRPSMLKKGHNILSFSLAAVDMLTCEFRQFPYPKGNHTQKGLKHKCTGDGWVM